MQRALHLLHQYRLALHASEGLAPAVAADVQALIAVMESPLFQGLLETQTFYHETLMAASQRAASPRPVDPAAKAATIVPADGVAPAAAATTTVVPGLGQTHTVELIKGANGLGLGLVRTPEGAFVVSRVTPNSPAAASGSLMDGDQILAVNGSALTGLDYGQVASVISASQPQVLLSVGRLPPLPDISSQDVMISLTKVWGLHPWRTREADYHFLTRSFRLMDRAWA